MKHYLLTLAAGALMVPSVIHADDMENSPRQNPFTQPYATPYEIPPFDLINYSDYLPALKEGIAVQKREIDAIVSNQATPTFENTILALDKTGETLEKTMLVFMTMDDALSTPELAKIAEEVYPLYSQWSDEMSMNPGLFKRVQYLYDNRDKMPLSIAQRRAIETSYKKFKRNGALLDEAGKARLSELNTLLTDLYLKYNKNILNATNSYTLVVDDQSRLGGLPASSVAVAAEEAQSRGLGEGKWVFTLHAPSRLPLLQYADDRDLRRQMYEAYTSMASSGEYDNRPVINEIVKARVEKAHLLGFSDYAAYMTDNVMAKTVDNAENLLMKVWAPAVKRVREEVADMQAVVDQEGQSFKIAPWDYYYYAEKVRRQKYALDEDAVRPYFAIDSVRKGIFTMANILYGVNFTEMPDAPKYHPEVKVYDVTDNNGEHVAVFMTDYFPRSSKRQGAWMSELKGSYTKDDGTSSRPIIYNVCN
nr:peptidase M3 [Muribaculaceae bacterium]